MGPHLTIPLSSGTETGSTPSRSDLSGHALVVSQHFNPVRLLVVITRWQHHRVRSPAENDHTQDRENSKAGHLVWRYAQIAHRIPSLKISGVSGMHLA
jgi:hypothetical protein